MERGGRADYEDVGTLQSTRRPVLHAANGQQWQVGLREPRT